MIDDVQVVSVPVSDQQRAKNFYVDKLGFELREDRLWAEGMRWVEVAPESSSTSLSLVTWFEAMPLVRSRASSWPRTTSGEPTKNSSPGASSSISFQGNYPAGARRYFATPTVTAWCSGNAGSMAAARTREPLSGRCRTRPAIRLRPRQTRVQSPASFANRRPGGERDGFRAGMA
jgi:catechol 2,3-dioxygenase-like lactoylglutathione lyase family enzyme